jgi:hypothetical protein
VDKRAEELLEAMQRARQEEREADEEFRRSAARAFDTGYSSDGTTGLRIAAKKYRLAVEEYSRAVTVWSDYTFPAPNKK